MSLHSYDIADLAGQHRRDLMATPRRTGGPEPAGAR